MRSEPDVPKGIRQSGLLWVPAAAPRQAPEELVLELMRSVFYAGTRPSVDRAKALSPSISDLLPVEAAIVRTLRGRQKKEATSSARIAHYYAPAYPELARASWLRRKDARVIEQFLFRTVFGGHISSYPSDEYRARLREQFARGTVSALLGDTLKSESGQSIDILAAALPHSRDMAPDAHQSLAAILDVSDAHSRRIGRTLGVDEDRHYPSCKFYRTASKDWLALMGLEPYLSRHHWLSLLSCYLRIVVPMAALVQTRGIVLLDGWIRSAIRGQPVPTRVEIETGLVERGRQLLRPTQDLCSDHLDAIAEYMRARARVSALIKDLVEKGTLTVEQASRTVVARRDPAPTEIGITELLETISARHEQYADTVSGEMGIARGDDFPERRAARLCERHSVWRKPLDVGPGKLLKWLMYPMYCIGQFDERGSHLLVQPGRRLMFTIEPGPLVLQFMTLMCSIRMREAGGRPPVLHDVEEHLRDYGIDFSARPAGRNLLMAYGRDASGSNTHRGPGSQAAGGVRTGTPLARRCGGGDRDPVDIGVERVLRRRP